MSETEGISVKDLYRLKHQVNQSITYGQSNQNAQQVKDLEHLVINVNYYSRSATIIIPVSYPLT